MSSKIKKAIRSAIIVWKKAILLGTTQNLQKTSVDFSNPYTGD